MNQSVPNILKKIIQRKEEIVTQRKKQVPLSLLQNKISEQLSPKTFAAAIEQRVHQQQPAIIAEIKKASPSKGLIRPNFDPAAIAKSYERSGATCLSVLTDEDFFQGCDNDLMIARTACHLPILRKDFVIDPYQIYESRAIGADCILLIAAALTDSQLKKLYLLANEIGLDVLIEVHNEDELQRILPLHSRLIGINNRNLHTFDVDLNVTLRLRDKIPSSRVIITESGIHSAGDVKKMMQKQIYAFLVGEAFMREDEPGEALAKLFSLQQ